MFVSPMLLHKTDPFDDKDWISELKLDGIRLIYSNLEDLKLYTRHNNDVTDQFPEIHINLPKGVILDGELVQMVDGKPDFEQIMSRFMIKRPGLISKSAKQSPVTYCVFDILYYKGQNITHLPLLERKEILEAVIPKDLDNIVKVQFIQGQGKTFFEAVKQQKLEGIVLKKANSKYAIGKRSSNWLKAVNYTYSNVYIVGYRKNDFGLLLEFENGDPAGILELGVPIEAKRAIYLLSDELKRSESKGFVYFKHALKCKVKYRHLLKSGLLRLPSFVEFTA